MTEQTYEEHISDMLRLGGGHECASDCPLPLPRRPDGCECHGGTEVASCLHCAELQPSGSPQTEAGRDHETAARREPLDVDAIMRQLAAGRRLDMSEAVYFMDEDVEKVLRAAARRETGTNPTKHAAWCWLPADHQGMCEGDQ